MSQFEQHVRAVCGLELGLPERSPPAAVMRNLLYSDKLARLVESADGPLRFSEHGSSLYWYGKREAREGRKMGHVTVINAGLDESVAVTERLIDIAAHAGTGADG